MEQWTEIRRRILVEKVSQRQILQLTRVKCAQIATYAGWHVRPKPAVRSKLIAACDDGANVRDCINL